jgi:hypothetical protein
MQHSRGLTALDSPQDRVLCCIGWRPAGGGWHVKWLTSLHATLWGLVVTPAAVQCHFGTTCPTVWVMVGLGCGQE